MSFKPTLVTEGEFAGWNVWPQEPFEQAAGPYYARVDETGPVSAFRVQRKHLNAGGSVHGGCLMAFADMAIFTIAMDEFADEEIGVTMTFSSEFLGRAGEGEFLAARGEVTRSGRSVIFVRGMIRAGERAVMSFSATIKRMKMPPGGFG